MTALIPVDLGRHSRISIRPLLPSALPRRPGRGLSWCECWRPRRHDHSRELDRERDWALIFECSDHPTAVPTRSHRRNRLTTFASLASAPRQACPRRW